MKKYLATAAVLMSLAAPATALDMAHMNKAAVALYVYDKDCAPLSASWRETVIAMLKAMDENERTRAVEEVSIVESEDKALFCEVVKSEAVDRLAP
jgi:hypothetical protein